MEHQFKPIQKIIFGSPGIGKSQRISQIAQQYLDIKIIPNLILLNTVKTVFHPEYTYSDFMGKLLPLSDGNHIIYKYYAGHFLQALGMAYKGLIEERRENYLLVIDELNRGNASAIFGSIFQLLDRNTLGWSTYDINISEMELLGLLTAMGYPAKIASGDIQVNKLPLDMFFQHNVKASDDYISQLIDLLERHKIKIPPNLSIIATINTSDESIYYLDSAFKRRWDWEYIDAPNEVNLLLTCVPYELRRTTLAIGTDKSLTWYRCIIGINKFIKSHHQNIRRIEDKQIGWWFIQPKNNQVTLEQVECKLMFYLWDSVFTRNKQLLANFLEKDLKKRNVNLVTFADFLNYTVPLLEYWHDIIPDLENNEEEFF